MLRDIVYPVSGLTGNLLRLPSLGVSFGDLVDRRDPDRRRPLQPAVGHGPRSRRRSSSMLDFAGDQTTSVEDIVIGTKIRLVSETESAVRPSASVSRPSCRTRRNESGLGLDTTDFFASLLVGKTVQSIRVVGNAGLGILGDPTRGDRQNDVLTYGFSLARAVRQGLEVVGEINGRLDVRDGEPPPGTESRGTMRVGGRFTRGTVRVDGALLLGMTEA